MITRNINQIYELIRILLKCNVNLNFIQRKIYSKHILLINKLYETNYIYLIFSTRIKFKFNLLYKMNNLRNIFKYTFLVRKINFSNQFRQQILGKQKDYNKNNIKNKIFND